MLTYTPQIWKNTTLGPIFSEMLFANKTVSEGLVRVLQNIKYKQVVTTLAGDLTDQAYAVNPTSAGNISFGDAEIAPELRQVFYTFDMNGLQGSRFGQDMASGAARMESNEFLKAVLEFAVPKVGKAIETRYWNSLVGKLNAAGFSGGTAAPIVIAATTLSAANIADEMEKIYTAIPGEVLEGTEGKIYAPHAVKQMIKVANLNRAYRDLFLVDGEKISYLGVPVEFVPLAANKIVAGRSTDLILGTDLASDFGALEVGKVNNTGDQMFIKATYSLDSAVCIPTQKVIYS